VLEQGETDDVHEVERRGDSALAPCPLLGSPLMSRHRPMATPAEQPPRRRSRWSECCENQVIRLPQ
jgi:hypothetical protein